MDPDDPNITVRRLSPQELTSNHQRRSILQSAIITLTSIHEDPTVLADYRGKAKKAITDLRAIIEQLERDADLPWAKPSKQRQKARRGQRSSQESE